MTIEAADLPTTSVAEHFPPDTEVTITVTGRVVYSDSKHGGLVIEYLNGCWPDRLRVHANAPAVQVAAAPCPDGAELRARAEAAGRLVRTYVDPDPERAHALHAEWVARWNAAYPVGTPVRYWLGVREGAGIATKTREPASVLGGHTSVVWVEAGAGAVALTHVEPIMEG